ncbi:unnamed protein product, partial [Gadus morhua 'NCC']
MDEEGAGSHTAPQDATGPTPQGRRRRTDVAGPTPQGRRRRADAAGPTPQGRRHRAVPHDSPAGAKTSGDSVSWLASRAPAVSGTEGRGRRKMIKTKYSGIRAAQLNVNKQRAVFPRVSEGEKPNSCPPNANRCGPISQLQAEVLRPFDHQRAPRFSQSRPAVLSQVQPITTCRPLTGSANHDLPSSHKFSQSRAALRSVALVTAYLLVQERRDSLEARRRPCPHLRQGGGTTEAP